jgi:hypothetical protein
LNGSRKHFSATILQTGPATSIQEELTVQKRIILSACTLLLCLGTMAFAQDKKEPATIGGVLDHSLASVEQELVPAIEAMPEDKFNFAPTSGEFKGVRTFAQQAKHVAAVNYTLAATILGEKNPIDPGKEENGPDNITSKADVVKFLKDSFAYLHKAMVTINANNVVAPIKNAWGERMVTRMYLASVAMTHPYDHYGQIVVYLRMNGIIPPASR